MSVRARGQLTLRMLPRLILITLLAAGGLQTAATAQYPNVLGLRRGIDRAVVGGSDRVVGSCVGNGCVKVGNGRDNALEVKESGDEKMGDEEDDEDGDEDETAVEEGRGKKGKQKKGYGKYLIILAGMTKAAMLYIMIHAVAALAGKALIVAKVALAIATALALKKSIDHKTSYEIVKHPTYSHVQTHSSSVDYDHGSGGGGGYEGGSRRKRSARR